MLLSSSKGIHIDDDKIIENISGPVSFSLLVNKRLPTVILLGDIHGSYDNMCDEKMPNTYKVFEQRFIDLFDVEGVHYYIEDSHDRSDTMNSFDSKDSLVDTISYASDCYNNPQQKCKSKYIKWHYTDVRYIDDKNKNDFLYMIQVFEDIFGYILEDGLPRTETAFRSLFDELYVDLKKMKTLQRCVKYMNIFDSFSDCIVNSPLIKKQEKKCKLQLLTKLRDFYKVEEQKEFNQNSYYFLNFGEFKSYMTYLVNDFDSFMNDSDRNKTNLRNFVKTPQLKAFKNILFNLRAFTVDIYAIQRSYKHKYNSKLNIFYLGQSHITNILHFFKFCKLYSVKYQSNPTSIDEHGHILHKDEDDDYYDYVNRCVPINKYIRIHNKKLND